MTKSIGTNNGEDLAPKFPGPLTLVPSLKKRFNLLIGAGFFTIAGILLSFGAGISFDGRIAGALATTFFGVCTVMAMIQLLPGSSSLRLDGNGFEITRYFRKQEFGWSEVSDFGVWTYLGSSIVVFKAAKSRLGIREKLNAALTGGRNDYLQSFHQLAPDDLVQLLTTWRNLAMTATKQTGS
jgi:hypothetical protein